jgi:hypothetical protein
MCRVFRLIVLGALLALPLSAAQKEGPSLTAFLQSLSPAATAQAKTVVCPQGQGGCGGCVPTFNDCRDRVYTGVNFVRQKDNDVCVYQCPYTQQCYDSSCGNPNPIPQTGAIRVRSAPGEYAMGACPAPDPNFCTTMEVGE